MSATNVVRSKQARRMPPQGAIDMTRGKGDKRYTFYQAGLVETAREKGVGIRVVKRSANGTIRNVLTTARMVHRSDLTAAFTKPHPNAGQGKYIVADALSKNSKVVTGANKVRPYRTDDGSYATLLEALQSGIPTKSLQLVVGDISENQTDGQHITWRGRAAKDAAILLGSWMTFEQIWQKCLELNSALKRNLSGNKSQVKGVKNHLNSRDKLQQSLEVMRRAREVFHIASGETEVGEGGATPYAMPLIQCGFAIDKFYLTNEFDDDGNEIGEYFYRLVVGRGTPWTLYKREWQGLDTNAKFAYLNEQIRQRALVKGKGKTKQNAA